MSIIRRSAFRAVHLALLSALHLVVLLVVLLVSLSSFGATKQRYFVGLWAKLEDADRAKLSWSLKSHDDKEMIEGVVVMQAELAERLLRDREQLAAWTRSQGLSNEIKILDIPIDGSFTLFDTTPEIAQEIVQASKSGDLPAIFSNLAL